MMKNIFFITQEYLGFCLQVEIVSILDLKVYNQGSYKANFLSANSINYYP